MKFIKIFLFLISINFQQATAFSDAIITADEILRSFHLIELLGEVAEDNYYPGDSDVAGSTTSADTASKSIFSSKVYNAKYCKKSPPWGELYFCDDGVNKYTGLGDVKGVNFYPLKVKPQKNIDSKDNERNYQNVSKGRKAYTKGREYLINNDFYNAVQWLEMSKELGFDQSNKLLALAQELLEKSANKSDEDGYASETDIVTNTKNDLSIINRASSNDALTCSAVFTLLTTISEPEGFNRNLTSLALTMKQIYTNLEAKNSGVNLTNEEITNSRDKVLINLGKLYDSNPGQLVDKYIKCNKWREDIATQVRNKKPLDEILKNPPRPLDIATIQISKEKREIHKNQIVLAMENWSALGRFTRTSKKSQLLDTLKKTKPLKLTNKINTLLKKANRGDATAQFQLAKIYDIGEGIPKNEKEAVKWYRKAAEQGQADAQNNLAICYETGKGVLKDEKEAVKWYRKAAEQGDPTSQTNLGLVYHYGKGALKDEKEAVKWYRKAAEQNFANAQFNLGWMYEKGKGTLKQPQEALKWYHKAAEQGHADAQNNLGAMYADGKDIPKDLSKAKHWIKKAFENPKASKSIRSKAEENWKKFKLWKY